MRTRLAVHDAGAGRRALAMSGGVGLAAVLLACKPAPGAFDVGATPNATTDAATQAPTARASSTADADDGAPPPEVGPLNRGVVVKVRAERTAHGEGVVLRGETNLPEGVLMHVEVKAPDDLAVSYESEVTVARGRFHTAPVDAADGEYVAELFTLRPFAQPEAVRKAIGDDGERLRGALVHKDSAGATVEVTSAPFVVGDDKDKARDASRAARAELRSALTASIATLREIVNRWRVADRTFGPTCMRQLVADREVCKAVAAPLQHLPLTMPGAGTLRGAVSSVESCAACDGPGAHPTCADAVEELKRAEDELAETARAAAPQPGGGRSKRERSK